MKKVQHTYDMLLFFWLNYQEITEYLKPVTEEFVMNT